MIPFEVPPLEVWGPLLAGAGALITALVGFAKILEELKPNHGSSMRDAVNALLKRVEALGDQVDQMTGQVSQNSTKLGALRDDMSDVRSSIRRHDRELGRANDLASGAQSRTTQAERRYDEQLSDHSLRLHHLETLTIHKTGDVQ